MEGSSPATRQPPATFILNPGSQRGPPGAAGEEATGGDPRGEASSPRRCRQCQGQMAEPPADFC